MSADISGTIVTQTQSQSVSAEIVNLGPNDAVGVVARTFTAEPLDQVSITSMGCTPVIAGPPGSQTLTWSIGNLAAGQARQCRFEFRARPTSAAAPLGFSLVASRDSPVDPQGGNNRIGTLFLVSSFDVPVELNLSGTLVPSGPLPPDGSARITLVLRNSGSAPAVQAGVSSDSYLPPSFGGAFRLVPAAGNACDVFYDGELFERVDLVAPGGLAPGGQITCVLAVQPTANVPLEGFRIGFTAGASGFGITDDPGDNRVVLGVLPPAAPVPLSGYAWWVLAGLIFCVSLFRRRVGR